MFYYIDQPHNTSIPVGLVKTESDFIVRSVETGLGRWTLVVAVISVDAYLRGWSKKNPKVYDVISCLSKNLITHFVWYLEKEIWCDTETLSINRELSKEHFYRKTMQKMCTKS